MVEKGASDLHLTANSPPCLRINGKMYPLKTQPLTAPDLESLAYSIMNERQKKTFEETNECDLSFRWKSMSRFRANFYRQQGFVAGAIRGIPNQVRTLTELGIPSAANELIDRPGGAGVGDRADRFG